MNPFYDTEKLGLDIITFDEPDMSYSFNTLIFVRPKGKKGFVYSASDSGCSCPTPFEDFEGDSQEAVLSKMERVGTYKNATKKFEEWNQPYKNSQPYLSASTFSESAVKSWFRG